jgi:PAS domain S-box-containing protein
MAPSSEKTEKENRVSKSHAANRKESDDIPPIRQLNILIVDDDPVDRMTLLRALKRSKLDPKIREAMDIKSALEAIRKSPFDVLILDHILPDGKSVDLLRWLHDASIRLPVVVTTGYGDEMLVADLLKAGAADYIPKDRITANSITRAISHAIRIHKAKEEKLKKDTLLEAGAEAVILLNTQTERISVVSGALGILGRALRVDRLTAFEQSVQATSKLPAISHRFDWSRDSDDFTFNNPALQNVTFQSLGLARWHTVILKGHSIGGPVRTLPPVEQPFFTGRGVASILAVPVLVDGRCWGFVLIEDRRSERTWTDGEKNMLTSIATAIGGTLIHRRAYEALRQSEERFRAIVEAQTDLICRFLSDGALTFVNEACCRYFGKKREELIHRAFTSFIAQEDQSDVMGKLSSLSPQNPIVATETRMIGPNNQIYWTRWTYLAIFNPQGQRIEIQGVGLDITERKRGELTLQNSEIKYRELVEQIPAVAYIARLDESIAMEYISPQIESIVGFTPADFRADPDLWQKSLHPDDLSRVTKCVTMSHVSGSSFACEYRMVAKDGRTVWVHDRATFVRDASGRPIFLQGVMYDISDRKNAEASPKRP